jgi:hypothetical protein
VIDPIEGESEVKRGEVSGSEDEAQSISIARIDVWRSRGCGELAGLSVFLTEEVGDEENRWGRRQGLFMRNGEQETEPGESHAR